MGAAARRERRELRAARGQCAHLVVDVVVCDGFVGNIVLKLSEGLSEGLFQTIAAEIALNFPEAFGMRLNELIAAGLMLFIITLAVNMIARAIVNKHKEFSGAN